MKAPEGVQQLLFSIGKGATATAESSGLRRLLELDDGNNNIDDLSTNGRRGENPSRELTSTTCPSAYTLVDASEASPSSETCSQTAVLTAPANPFAIEAITVSKIVAKSLSGSKESS